MLASTRRNSRKVACALIVLVGLVASQGQAAQVAATWGGGGDGVSYNDPLNWDIGQVPVNNATDTFIVVIPGLVAIDYNAAPVGAGTNTVDRFTLAADSTFNVKSGWLIAVSGDAAVGGTVNVENAGLFDAPSLTSSLTGTTARVLVQGTGATTATLGAGSYDSTGLTNGILLSADGSSTTLNLSSLATINDASNKSAAQVRTIEAKNGASLNLSGMHTVNGGLGDDTTRFLASAGGTIDLSGLTTVTGGTQFETDSALFTLPNLNTAGNMSFVVNPGTQIDLPKLTQQSDGAYNLPPIATLNVPNLTQLTGARVTIANTTVTFNAPVLATIDDTWFNLSGDANLGLPLVTSYTGNGFAGGTFLSADGGSTVLDLSAITTLTSSANYSAAQVRTISATGGGVVNLSGVNTINGATGDDTLQITQNGGGQITLTNLTTTTGNVRFTTDIDLEVTTLQNAGALFFTMQSGSQLDLPALISQSGGAYDMPAGATANLPVLATMTGTTVTIGDNVTVFNAPVLGNINDSFVNLSGDANLGLPLVTSYTGNGFANGTFFSADGGSTVLDLSAITTLTSSANYSAAQVRTISATGGGVVNLSGVNTINGATGDDTLQVTQNGGGQVTLTSLTTTTGNVRFTTDTNLEVTTLKNAGALFFSMQPGSQLDLPVLVSQGGGTYDLPAGATFNLPVLATMTGTTLRISDNTASFNAPNLSNIDNGFVDVSGGATLALPGVTGYVGTGFASGTFFKAAGAGTSLDLSGLQSIDSASNYSAAQIRTIEALDGALLDLSGVNTLKGGTGDDTLRVHVGSSATVDLSALQSVITGTVVFDVEAEGTLKLGPFTVTGNTTFNINDATSVVDVSGSLLLDDNAAFNVATGGGISVGGNFTFSTQDETKYVSASGRLQMDGAGTHASPQFMEVGGEDLGLPANLSDPTTIPGDDNNFALGQLIVGQAGKATVVQLQDAFDNGNRNSLEALYLPGFGADGLQILGGSTLNIDSINTYAFLDGQWVHLNALFGDGVTSIDITTLTKDPAVRGFVVLPEPATLSLLAAGGLLVMCRRRRRYRRDAA